ncbi:hypothetical protein [Nonomuraea aridisoli]|uniref:BA14K family protein n=1 Tax=Nonomuraea aridisoli TaxID=2070368 RepID=A0A2W2E978_9ACTN|nr:hypothetical protein [Nonomuraea aridisoli]PZG18951.1 hypothetical protein C1J01_13585 [Nonomuraea aridisoli]
MRRISRPLIVATVAGGLLALSAPAASANPDDHPYRGGLRSGLEAGFGAAAGPGFGAGLGGGLTGGLGLR